MSLRRRFLQGGASALVAQDLALTLPHSAHAAGPRALVGAAALGSLVGLAIGGAYLAGGLARTAVNHARIEKLAANSRGSLSETALKSAAGDAGVLAIAQRFDAGDSAAQDLDDRRLARLALRMGDAPASAYAAPKPVLGASTNVPAPGVPCGRRRGAAVPHARRPGRVPRPRMPDTGGLLRSPRRDRFRPGGRGAGGSEPRSPPGVPQERLRRGVPARRLRLPVLLRLRRFDLQAHGERPPGAGPRRWPRRLWTATSPPPSATPPTSTSPRWGRCGTRA